MYTTECLDPPCHHAAISHTLFTLTQNLFQYTCVLSVDQPHISGYIYTYKTNTPGVCVCQITLCPIRVIGHKHFRSPVKSQGCWGLFLAISYFSQITSHLLLLPSWPCWNPQDAPSKTLYNYSTSATWLGYPLSLQCSDAAVFTQWALPEVFRKTDRDYG